VLPFCPRPSGTSATLTGNLSVAINYNYLEDKGCSHEA